MRNKRGVKNMSFIDKLEETLEDISYKIGRASCRERV